MESEQLSLCWNDHSDGLITVFQDLLNSNTLVDCTLAAEGQYLKAHKVVLSACSPYFQVLFTQESEKNPIIILKDVKFKELKAVVDFIYRGEVKVCEKELGAFLEVATSLCIKGLSKDSKNMERDRTAVSDFSAAPKRKCIQRRSSNISEDVHEPTQTADTKELHRTNEFPLQHELCNVDTSNVSTTPCGIATAFNMHSSSQSLALDTHGSLRTTDSSQTQPSTQSPFSTVGRLHSTAASIVKTEMYEESGMAFGRETRGTSYREKPLLMGGKDVMIQEPTISGHSQSTLNHQYSHFSSSLMDTSELQESSNSILTSQQSDLSPEGGPNIAGAWRSQHGRRSPPKACHTPPVASPAPSEERPSSCESAASGVSKRSDSRAPSGRHLCLVCHKAFPTRCKLRNHWRTHTGDKPYKCLECGYACGDSSNMRRHRIQHLNAKAAAAAPDAASTVDFISALCAPSFLPPKRHSCPECHKVFTAPYRLRIHRRIHFGDKPFKCPECDYTCSDSSNMRRHQLHHLYARGITTPGTPALPQQSHVMYDSSYEDSNSQKAEVMSYSSAAPKGAKQ